MGDLFPVNGNGVVTKRDFLTIDEDKESLWKRIQFFINNPEGMVRAELKLPEDVRDWQFNWAKKDLTASGPDKGNLQRISYRPFDTRWIYYTGISRGFVGWPVPKIMSNYLKGENIGLLVSKSFKDKAFGHCFVTKSISEAIFLSSLTGSNAMNLPLYLYPAPQSEGLFSETHRRPNLSERLMAELAGRLGRRFESEGIIPALS